MTEKLCAPGRNWECSCCCPGPSGEATPTERKTTAWMRNSFAPCLYKLRWVLAVVTLGLLAGGGALLAVMFEEAEFKFTPDQVIMPRRAGCRVSLIPARSPLLLPHRNTGRTAARDHQIRHTPE